MDISDANQFACTRVAAHHHIVRRWAFRTGAVDGDPDCNGSLGVCASGDGASTLTRTVIAKLRHRAQNPAFNPKKGSLLLRIKNVAIPTPATIPMKTPAVVTRFQKRPSTTPGKNCVMPAYPSSSSET